MSNTTPPLLSASGRDGVVLVVDDVERNLQVVGELLTQQRYEVLFATNGKTALERAEAAQPDLILLDIMMPGMSGIEVCQRLQLNPLTQSIPVIFVTATHDAETAVKGFTEGAVDYVTKPFHAAELLARVSTHVALKHARDRNRQVITEKNDLMAAVAHDLKNPLTSIQIAGNVLRDGLVGDPKLEMANVIVDSCNELLSLIEDRLSRNAREAAIAQLSLSPINLRNLLQSVAQQNRPIAHAKDITLDLDLPLDTELNIQGDYHATAQIFDNLVSNAIKFSPRGKTVSIECGAPGSPGCIRIKVVDHGPGCSEADRRDLFKPYHRLSAKPTGGESSTGLGLSIAHDLVLKMSGRISCEDTTGGGATFWVELPESAA
ncbi:hybrid sensor histidine kinase/response regulator [Synoicihabitans lomoniglobus]|uniref:histidine kinase n=1 Tax=Synoicihabitans lomoniglobus TaxID=2909285 RepID=A0AAE9ZV14_9BACT|nr:hybrid sensor histidine kinase/response regulator [Opitutaceae bacterium LMO-M01]WED64696.1 hybrid sensor histidine kinase/response regulator [Opitutaceae bacterium LMO-M01]